MAVATATAAAATTKVAATAAAATATAAAATTTAAAAAMATEGAAMEVSVAAAVEAAARAAAARVVAARARPGSSGARRRTMRENPALKRDAPIAISLRVLVFWPPDLESREIEPRRTRGSAGGRISHPICHRHCLAPARTMRDRENPALKRDAPIAISLRVLVLWPPDLESREIEPRRTLGFAGGRSEKSPDMPPASPRITWCKKRVQRVSGEGRTKGARGVTTR